MTICKSAAALLILLLASPAVGQQPNIGFERFTLDGPASPEIDTLTKSVADLVITDLFKLLKEDPAYAKCDAKIIETLRRDEVLKELEFQQSRFVDPASRARPGRLIDPNRMVSGRIAASGEALRWTVELKGAGGKVLSTASGETAAIDMLDQGSAAIAKAIADEACKPKPVRVKAGMNDLTLSGLVCDPSQPFTLKGMGQTSGLTFAFTPSSNSSGAFTLSGLAGGVRWSGGGSYAMAETKGNGTISMPGSWSIATPVGSFPGSGTIKGPITDATKECGAQTR